MASQQEVRQYIAYWFQLGKKVFVGGMQDAYTPQPVLQGNRYSQEFENCWNEIQQVKGEGVYLEGTEQTIAELLTPAWEILGCVRCDMPVPLKVMGMPPKVCPCHDLPTWPNTEIPVPRAPIDGDLRLIDIKARLMNQDESH